MIETVRLLIWVHTGYDCTRWGELDDVLMGSPEGWRALREVSLSFHVIRTVRHGLDKAFRDPPMTKLVESKRVQFNFDVKAFPPTWRKHLNIEFRETLQKKENGNSLEVRCSLNDRCEKNPSYTAESLTTRTSCIYAYYTH